MSLNTPIKIFDTTLRDGDQSPGAAMSTANKIKIAQALDEMGVDVIEAGFAIASHGELQCIQKICKKIKNATVCSLARAKKIDIDAAILATKFAATSRIHLFISTSPIHLQHQLKISEQEVLRIIHDTVHYARQKCDDIQWSAMDATRSKIDFLARAVETAIKAGARTINIPDTVGYCLPQEYAHLIQTLHKKVPNIDKAIISTHCHNDLGLAVANSLAGISAGARQVECTINGIGERAGNAALEEIVMAIKTRHDKLDYSVNIKTDQFLNLSHLVSEATGFHIQKNKAIVGANAFVHGSGIHQDGMLKSRQTYEIMTPESVGIKKSKLVLTKHSGRAALHAKFALLGIHIEDDRFAKIFDRFKLLGDTKKLITEHDLLDLVNEKKHSKK